MAVSQGTKNIVSGVKNIINKIPYPFAPKQTQTSTSIPAKTVEGTNYIPPKTPSPFDKYFPDSPFNKQPKPPPGGGGGGGGGGGYTPPDFGGGGGSYVDPTTGIGYEQPPGNVPPIVITPAPPGYGGGGGGTGGGGSNQQQFFNQQQQNYNNAIQELNKQYAAGGFNWKGYNERAKGIYDKYSTALKNYETLIQEYEQKNIPTLKYYNPQEDKYYDTPQANTPVSVYVNPQTGKPIPNLEAYMKEKNLPYKIENTTDFFGGRTPQEFEEASKTYKPLITGFRGKEDYKILPATTFSEVVQTIAPKITPITDSSLIGIGSFGFGKNVVTRAGTQVGIAGLELGYDITKSLGIGTLQLGAAVGESGLGLTEVRYGKNPAYQFAKGEFQKTDTYKTLKEFNESYNKTIGYEGLKSIDIRKPSTYENLFLLQYPDIGNVYVTASLLTPGSGVIVAGLKTVIYGGMAYLQTKATIEQPSIKNILAETLILAPGIYKGAKFAKDIKTSYDLGISYSDLKTIKAYNKLSAVDFYKQYGEIGLKSYSDIQTRIITNVANKIDPINYLKIKEAPQSLSYGRIESEINIAKYERAIVTRQTLLEKQYPTYSRVQSEIFNYILKLQEQQNIEAIQKGYYAQLESQALKEKNPIRYADLEQDKIVKQAEMLLEKSNLLQQQDIINIPGSLKLEYGTGFTKESITNRKLSINLGKFEPSFTKERTDVTQFFQDRKINIGEGDILVKDLITLTPEQYLKKLVKEKKIEYISPFTVSSLKRYGFIEKVGERYTFLGKEGVFATHVTKGERIIIPEQLIRKMFGQERFVADLSHELIHYKQSQRFYDKYFRPVEARLPYRLQPSEIEAYARMENVAKKGFVVKVLRPGKAREAFKFLDERDLILEDKSRLVDMRKFTETGKGMVDIKGRERYDLLSDESINRRLQGTVLTPEPTLFTTKGSFKQLRSYREGLLVGEGAEATFIPFKSRGRPTIEGYAQKIVVELAKDIHKTSIEPTEYTLLLKRGGTVKVIKSVQTVQDLVAPIEKKSFLRGEYEQLKTKRNVLDYLNVPKKGYIKLGKGRIDVTTLVKIGDDAIKRNVNYYGRNFREISQTNIGSYIKKSEFAELRDVAKYSKDDLRVARQTLKEVFGKEVDFEVVSKRALSSNEMIDIGSSGQTQMVSLQKLTAPTVSPILGPAELPIRNLYASEQYYNALTKKIGLGGAVIGFGIEGGIAIAPTPTIQPTITPQIIPIIQPTIMPTIQPTILPTIQPTITPTITPEITPTIQPTITPQITPIITPIITPQINPPFTPFISFDNILARRFGMERKRKKAIKQVPTFSVQIKRRGQFKPIATDLTKSQVLKFGSERALGTLARTFLIKPTGKQKEIFGIDEEQMIPELRKFREFKIRKGKAIKTPGQFTQLTEANLKSYGEKSEIKLAKQIKGYTLD